MSTALRNRYLGNSVGTASPGRLLVMLYQRLLRDLHQAEAALRKSDREQASKQLFHAQEIIIELRTSLRMDVWDGAVGLAKIYGFLLSELIAANLKASADQVASCIKLVEPLAEAWQLALVELEQGPATAGTTAVGAAAAMVSGANPTSTNPAGSARTA
jgi:flagellar secretion chaperone FliS